MEALDIFWIVLSFCLLWITAFVCWVIYHIAMVARKIHVALDETKNVLAQIESGIAGMKAKMEHYSKILDPLVALAGSVVRDVKRFKKGE